MAESETTRLGLLKRLQGEDVPWAYLHNDSMDLIEDLLSHVQSTDPNVDRAGTYVGEVCVQTGTGDEFPDIWICTATGEAGVATWTALHQSVRKHTKSVGGAWVAADPDGGGAIAMDFDDSNFFTSALDKDSIVSAPSNIPAAGTFILEVTQDSTARTLGWNAVFKWAFGAEITMPTDTDAIHLFQIIIDSSGAPVVTPLFSIAVPA